MHGGDEAGRPARAVAVSVKIPDTLVLQEVQFPIVVLRAPLGDSVEDDARVFATRKAASSANRAP